MEHDLFTGETNGVIYKDPALIDVVENLSDIAEIDHILKQVSDPFGMCEDSTDRESQFNLFLTEFKSA